MNMQRRDALILLTNIHELTLTLLLRQREGVDLRNGVAHRRGREGDCKDHLAGDECHVVRLTVLDDTIHAEEAVLISHNSGVSRGVIHLTVGPLHCLSSSWRAVPTEQLAAQREGKGCMQ